MMFMYASKSELWGHIWQLNAKCNMNLFNNIVRNAGIIREHLYLNR